MKISRNLSVSDVKKKFNEQYPGLKLEFYEKPHEPYQGSLAKLQLPDQTQLEQLTKEGEINLSPSRSVEEVEQQFENEFGLHVQIYRRSKDLWLQTSSTDHWTLEVQNRKGIHSITA